jgi:hypothetical protein
MFHTEYPEGHFGAKVRRVVIMGTIGHATDQDSTEETVFGLRGQCT